MTVSLQFEGAQFPTVSFRLSSKKIELQHTSSSGRLASVGRLQHLFASERAYQHSLVVAMAVRHDSYSSRHSSRTR